MEDGKVEKKIQENQLDRADTKTFITQRMYLQREREAVKLERKIVNRRSEIAMK